MSKYAITIGSSHAYLQGLNATLNAIDYYGVKDVDVYVFSNKFLKPYFDYLEGKFDFPLYYLDAEELCPDNETQFAADGGVAWKDVMFFWGKYPLFKQIMHKYDAIMHLDADMMLVDDISEYFKIAAESGKLLIAGNGRSVYSLKQIEEPRFNTTPNELLEFCKGFPVINYVFCMDAKKYIPLLDYVWDLRNDTERNTKHYGLETAYFVQGLYKCNLLDQVVELPFGHWISDNYLTNTRIPLEKDNNGKYHLIAPDGKPIQVVHGRFWNAHVTNHTLDLTDPRRSPHNHASQYEVALFNVESHTRLTDFLNYEWKAKIQEVLALNSNYAPYIDVHTAWTRVSRFLEQPWGQR